MCSSGCEHTLGSHRKCGSQMGRCRGRQLKETSKTLSGLVRVMVQNAGGWPGLLPSSPDVYLSGAGFGQWWLTHFVKGAQWKQDGEMRPTQAWEGLLCSDQPYYPLLIWLIICFQRRFTPRVLCYQLAVHKASPKDEKPRENKAPACGSP